MLYSAFVSTLSLLFVLPHSMGLPLEDDRDNAIDGGPITIPILSERAFKEPDPEVGKRLESWNETSGVNPEEYGGYLEGDIIMPGSSRNGLIGETYRWKNGEVPYEISGAFSQDGLDMIHRAMNLYKKYTCVSFRKRLPTDDSYISITNTKTGCWSSVGRIGGKQELNLQSPSCTTKLGTPVHELMHAVGFLHEQNRNERDDYVNIVWGNIQSGHERNFDKAEKGTAQGYGVSYDYKSVMHYSSTAFSTNGQPTIVSKDPKKNGKMGQRDGFSRGDITKINAMYNCPEKTAAVTGSGTGTGTGSDNVKPSGEKEESTNPLLQAASHLLSLFINKK